MNWLRIATVLAWVHAVCWSALSAVFALIVLSAWTDSSQNPHGYATIFGILALVVALPLLLSSWSAALSLRKGWPSGASSLVVVAIVTLLLAIMLPSLLVIAPVEVAAVVAGIRARRDLRAALSREDAGSSP